MMATKENRKQDPVAEMREFIDEVRDIAPLTVESTPDGGISSVKVGPTEKLNEVSDSAEKHGLLLTYDGMQVVVTAINPEALPEIPPVGGAAP